MRYRNLLYGLAILLGLLSAGLPAAADALENGAYVVSNTTYYVNPDTGASDDGGDTSTGEGMCRNTTYAESLYGVSKDEHYVVLRIKLISFISNIRFDVQQTKGDSSSYQSAEYTVVGENEEENTKDFKIKLPAGDVLIKPSFFVGPMNRDVTYFIGLDLGTAQKDDGTFAAFNQGKVNSAGGSDTTAESMAEIAEKNNQDKKSLVETEPVKTEQVPETKQEKSGTEGPGDLQDEASSGAITAGAVDSSEEAGEVKGIQEFSADGDKLAEKASHSKATTPVILGIALLAVVGAGIAFAVLKRKKA